MYEVYRVSPNGHVRYYVECFNTYDKAHDYCDSMNWEYVDLSGIEWELVIMETCNERV